METRKNEPWVREDRKDGGSSGHRGAVLHDGQGGPD